jgi:two-component system response regulator WspF
MRIGIVNDTPMALEALRRIVSEMPDCEVAWLARDGTEAILKCCENTPDLVLMDLIMPGIDGAETTGRIMKECPCAILVVTASVTANQALAFKALTAGAIDVVRTPAVTDADGNGHLQRKIYNISRLIRKDAPTSERRAQPRSRATEANDSDENCLLISIGASTGGPAAVVDVLKMLPSSFPAAVILVLHVDKEFAPGMAEWMNGMTNLPVHLVREGERPKAGEVLLAATNEHLVLTHNQTLHYTPEPVDYPYRPSVDTFFSSLVQHWRGEAVGVLLTGMGKDGAKGLKSMREQDWHTISQDEKSSVFYGMPKAAATIGAACEIFPLEKIGPELIRLTEKFKKKKHSKTAHMHGDNHGKQ